MSQSTSFGDTLGQEIPNPHDPYNLCGTTVLYDTGYTYFALKIEEISITPAVISFLHRQILQENWEERFAYSHSVTLCAWKLDTYFKVPHIKAQVNMAKGGGKGKGIGKGRSFFFQSAKGGT